jgi:hypothetical protein
MDLKIASIAVSQQCPLLTANTRDLTLKRSQICASKIGSTNEPRGGIGVGNTLLTSGSAQQKPFVSGTNNRIFVALLVSDDTAEDSTSVLIACFDEECDRPFHGEIVCPVCAILHCVADRIQ